MSDTRTSRGVRILREDVANRIAAGEVIDRPLSIVRELMDNAIDSGARSVQVWLDRGGLDLIRVADDGSGMSPEDLELCWLPHATSKIRSLEDLQTASSLGFRGEALSSIGVCATLEITSLAPDQATAWKVQVRDGRKLSLEAVGASHGTDVRVTGLFDHQPARKSFLRSASAESALCAGVFLDKALPHPDLEFRLHTNRELKYHLPVSTPEERVLLAYPDLHAAGMQTVTAQSGETSVTVVLGRPEAARRDRRMLQVFVNGRRIWDYSLLQAVEYGYTGTIPGGLHPAGFVFVRMAPSLVDFNIHPAKREARFRDPGQLHRQVVDAVRRMVAPVARGPGRASVSGPRGAADLPLPWSVEGRAEDGVSPAHADRVAEPTVAEPTGAAPVHTDRASDAGPVVFHGQVFGVFLIAETAGTLYLIDQHAAHERLIFDRISREPATVQELLLPLSFEVDAAEAEHADRQRAVLAACGVVVERGPGRSYEVVALDERLRTIPEEKLLDTIRGRRGEAGSLRRELCAMAACAAAVREGERLDQATALDLVRRALALPEPRCPHGRPVWHAVSRDELYRLVKREI